ncbi:MAG: hypothetical protein SOZ23_04990 [Methanosphaera sp.]|uniref:hypothetical protein n=1 Tax=Methanosphaera sp. TaxID=2666342 RepID=UPI0025FFFE77|nr:hypothetical protein [Methanosphaera sp.]MCI5867591.1 hypothetical protein [Methanosphaera sp.]MDD6534058.1 hypothetical protein [Methanosphaera sp.]MDY3956132.1 hypothetical protein [Methanosphaera sp.]
MDNEDKLITNINLEESLIRKIGDNTFLKIIPSEKIVETSTIEQENITKPISQVDKVIIKAAPVELNLYKSGSNFKYETKWITQDDETIEIPASDLRTIYNTLDEKDLVVADEKLNLSNIFSMIIKQDTLKRKIENIKEEM